VHVREKHYLTVKVIIKGCVGVKKYRMESNTANFFEEIGLIDGDITYKIVHLSKYLVAIEHRANCGTVNAIINEILPEFKKVEALILTDLQRRKATNPDRRLLEIYDGSNRRESRVRFSEFIYHRAKNIRDWWRRYSNFVRTHAQWSYLGYVVGLGDRHCDNILLTEEGKLIHIDFEYALDTGLKLPYPEWVPFRLTSCFVEPLGLLGVYGLYFAEMVSTARQFE
jgi:phosphatidylinositol kinase/protein kinase (PI-3  family)